MSVKDYECPVCFFVLIKPITLPCLHNICLKCFDNIKSPLCPLCQYCFNDFKKSAMNSALLVNWKKYQDIMVNHSKKHMKAIQGLDYSSSSDNEIETILNKSGEIGQENYDNLVKPKYNKNMLENEEASLKLIEQFRKEDMMARKELYNKINNLSKDEIMAYKLFKEINNQPDLKSPVPLINPPSEILGNLHEINRSVISTTEVNLLSEESSSYLSQANHFTPLLINKQIDSIPIKNTKIESYFDKWIIKKVSSPEFMNLSSSSSYTSIDSDDPIICSNSVILSNNIDTSKIYKIPNSFCQKDNLSNFKEEPCLRNQHIDRIENALRQNIHLNNRLDIESSDDSNNLTDNNLKFNNDMEINNKKTLDHNVEVGYVLSKYENNYFTEDKDIAIDKLRKRSRINSFKDHILNKKQNFNALTKKRKSKDLISNLNSSFVEDDCTEIDLLPPTKIKGQSKNTNVISTDEETDNIKPIIRKSERVKRKAMIKSK